MSALDFGGGNTSRYYAFSGPSLPNGDWCIGFWYRCPAGFTTSMDFQYLVSGGTVGGTNSLHVFWGDSSNLGEIVVRLRGAAGTEINWTAATAGQQGLSGPTYIDSTTNKLFVLQRRSGTLEAYVADFGDAVTAPINTISMGANTTISPASWNFGRRPDGSATRYFGNVASDLFMLTGDSLSAAEVELMASGLPITAIRANRLLDLRLRDGLAIEPDLSGNGYHATRNGTGWALVDDPYQERLANPLFLAANF